VARLGGVFELELRHALLAIFERQITESELRSLHARTTTPEGLVNTIRSDNDRQMLQRLGLASSIVRGRAFAQAARSEGRGACLHPLRRIVLGGTADDAGGVSVDELLLANLVINSASLPLSTTDRTQRWVANITKIIRAGRSGVRLPYDDRSHLPPGQALADRDVVRRVCDFARALDLDIATKSHDAAVDACIGLGGELLQQALLPIGLPPGSVSIATSYWAEFTGIGPRIANRINRNNWHLTKLMQAPLQCVIKAPR
jgi:hypothetical protein